MTPPPCRTLSCTVLPHDTIHATTLTPLLQGTHDMQLLASMPHLKKLVAHSLHPEERIAPPCAWQDLHIVDFSGDLGLLSMLPLAGLTALHLDSCVR